MSAIQNSPELIILDRKVDDLIFLEVDEFIRSHPDGTIFQSSVYYKTFLGSRNNRPVLIISRQDGNISGVLLVIIQYQLYGILRFLTARSVIFDGPIVKDNNPETASAILKAYNTYASSKVIYSQFRNLHDLSNFELIFSGLGYTYEDHLNILVDLRKSEDQLWKELHPKRRNEIRKAEKEELTFRLIDNETEFGKSYSILNTLYTNIRLPVYNKKIFKNAMYQQSTGFHVRFFGAYYDETLIGTMYTLCYKSTIYDWFAGSDSQYYNKYPNDFLPWKIFLWAKENGYTTFDWGGAGKPGVAYGVRDYKAKFGGAFVNFGRYEKIHKPVLFFIARIGFHMWRKLKAVMK